MIDIDAALNYLSFVEERHRIWTARQNGLSGPWTDDPYLSVHKFTNVFRVLDYGSQYLLRHLIDPDDDPRDVLMRCFLYRHTGRTDAWDYLLTSEGTPRVADLQVVLSAFRAYRGGVRPLFTDAYLVYPQSHAPGTEKIERIVDLTWRLFHPDSPDDVMPAWLATRSQEERFAVLRHNKGVGDFMAMQILTDWGYTTHCGEDREDDFVVLGPGARRGAAALSPGTRDLLSVHSRAVALVRASPGCPTVAGRPPSWMDIQNTLCEYSKLVRFQTRPLPVGPYLPAHPGPQPPPLLPEHWR